jgi:hypothetical protein
MTDYYSLFFNMIHLELICFQINLLLKTFSNFILVDRNNILMVNVSYFIHIILLNLFVNYQYQFFYLKLYHFLEEEK